MKDKEIKAIQDNILLAQKVVERGAKALKELAKATSDLLEALRKAGKDGDEDKLG